MSEPPRWSSRRPTRPGVYQAKFDPSRGGVSVNLNIVQGDDKLYVDFGNGDKILLNSSAYDGVRWACSVDATLEALKDRLNRLLDDVEKQVDLHLVPGGDTEETSQRLCILNRVKATRATVTGIGKEDLRQ